MGKHNRATDNTLRELGSLIARRRHEKGKTSAEVAELLEITQSGMSRIENGSREIRLDMLRRIAIILDLHDPIANFLRYGKFSPDS